MLEFLEFLLLGASGWCLTLIAPPHDVGTHTYGELTEALISQRAMHPLGLLRDCAECESAPPVLVLPNPPRETVVGPTDRVFVLALGADAGQPAAPAARGARANGPYQDQPRERRAVRANTGLTDSL